MPMHDWSRVTPGIWHNFPYRWIAAVIELVSPGNQDSRHALRSFVEKAVDLLHEHVNLLVIDPFPPGHRDPQGIHQAIWDQIADNAFALPDDRPLTLVL
ncbi:MAG: hypothetical protein ACKO2P_20740 [Planctomycetota bacterium]